MEDKTRARKRVKSQDQRQEQAKKAARKKQKAEISKFLMQARRDINFWKSDFCCDLREFYRHALSHSEQFPMVPTDSSLVDAQDPVPSINSLPQLSDGFIDCVARRAFDELDSKHAHPIVRVLACDIKCEEAGHKREHPKARRARLLLSDGSNTVCLCVAVNNLLHSVQEQLTKGQPIMQLEKFNVTECEDTGRSDAARHLVAAKPGVVMVQHVFLCRPLLDVNPNSFSHACMAQEVPGEDGDKTNYDVDAIRCLQEPTAEFHSRIIAFQKRDDVRILPDSCLKFCQRDHRLCSRYGQKFHYCLAENYADRVESEEFLESIAQQCYFVDREVSEMGNNLKRNVLYYWFATNMHFIKGLGIRKPLPECLLCLIRMCYPNDPQTPCKEHSKK